jgi:ABC-2 type transport system ATP-binding protein
MGAVEVHDLIVDYGTLRAVNCLSFEVASGEIFALVGPNGAGKTTTLEVLEGYRPATSGTVRVLGMDPATGGRDLRERIGIVLQEAGFDELLSVREMLELWSGFYPRRRDPTELLELVDLVEKRNARVRSLSGGQRRRLDLALGLTGDPDMLFLDEPTTGFDPSARRQAWQLVDNLRDLGKTVLLTTHYMDEAQHLADRVGVIASGRLVAVGSPDELRASTRSTAVISFELPPGTPLADVPLTGNRAVTGSTVEFRSDHPTRDLQLLTSWADGLGVELPSLRLAQPSLEEVYLELIGDATAARG